MQETYQAVIVEDDPMIASIDQNFLERDPRFRLAASFRSGQDALPWLLRHPADLLILDVYMPRMTGLELLRELRSFGITSDAVMVTAANDSKTVDALLKLGVADYLVKPFTARRFQQALDKFCRQRSAIATHSSVSQEELDALLGAPEGFTVTVRDLKVSAGAGFLVALTGDIMTMPGLPKIPSAEKIDVDEDGRITGLF